MDHAILNKVCCDSVDAALKNGHVKAIEREAEGLLDGLLTGRWV